MIAAELTNLDVLMLVIIFVLLLVLVFLSVAEMGLSRMTKPKAQSLADRGEKGGKALVRLVSDPERWVNPLLLTVNICQTVQATLTGIVAASLFGAAGVIVGVVLNVLVFFVLAEAVPKTYAVLYSERAALISARPTLVLVSFPPLKLVSHALISLTNVIVRGKGLKQGPFVSEQELLGIVEAAGDDQVIEREEVELVRSIIEFGDTVAREIMTPRPGPGDGRSHGHRRRGDRRGDELRLQPPPGDRRRRGGRGRARRGLRQGPRTAPSARVVAAGRSPTSCATCTSCRRASRSAG